MSISANASGGNTTFTITRTVTNAQAQNLRTNFVAAMYQRGYAGYPRDPEGNMLPTNQLTTQQALDMMEQFMIEAVRDASRRYLQDQEEIAARSSIQNAVNTGINL